MAAICRYVGGMDEVKITVRLPAKVHTALVGAAEEDQRSLNGELVFLLTQSDRLKHWVLENYPRGNRE